MTDFNVETVCHVSDSLKWGKYRSRDILPMWVADMDYPASPAIINALTARVTQGLFGYSIPPDGLIETIIEYLLERYGWTIEPDWIVWMPGLVSALNVICRACAPSPGDEVLSFVPVYPPFLTAPTNQSASLITVPLGNDPDRQRAVFDLDAFAAAITPRSRLFLLCSPHNPAGRCWERAELEALAEICIKNDIVICSDEIHCDLILDLVRHTPTAMLSDDIASRTITLMAPSKTYNIPGLNCSFAIIPDSQLRHRFNQARKDIVPHNNVLGYTAALAAYRDSQAWYQEMIGQLRARRDQVEQAIANLPGVRMDHVEATYLAWIDVRELNLHNPAEQFEQFGLGLSDGKFFDGNGYVRLNFATSQERLAEGLNRFEKAVRIFSR